MRKKGVVKLASNYEVVAAAPIDARRLAQFKSDLFDTPNWQHTDGNFYIYNGLDVIVFGDTPENNGIYILNNAGNYAQEASWTKQTSSTNITIPGVNPTGNYDETANKVYDSGDTVSIGGILYICTVDGTTNIKPTVTVGWENNWALFQLKGSTGAAGESPYINPTTKEWNIKKPDGTIHNFEVKAEGVNGITPHIENGYWYIGTNQYNKSTGTSIAIQKVDDKYYWFLDGTNSWVLAEGIPGKSAIANINLTGTWKTNTDYWNTKPSTGKTDVVVGSDGIMYYALVNNRNVNPVTDTGNNTWVVFAMYGETGASGETPYIKDGIWYIGEDPVFDKTTNAMIRAEGSVITISPDGYWVINGTKTEKEASITIINETTVERDSYPTNIYEVTLDGINPRGIFVQGQTYYNVNVAEDGKTDTVVGSDGQGYICKVDGTTIDPVTDTTYTNWALFSMAGSPGKTPYLQRNEIDGKIHWFIGDNDQMVVAEGVDGDSGDNGVNGYEPYITETGYWAFKRLSNDGLKTVVENKTTTIKAEANQPNIRQGMWYIGDAPTGVQAIGQNAIANLNYVEEWQNNVKYYHSNPNVNNWTDVVLAADDAWYYAKNNNIPIGNNPVKLVNNVWVRDTANAQYWAVYATKGTRGDDGQAAEMRWYGDKLQWRTIGTETWHDLISKQDLELPILSDISTPIGSVIMFSGKAVNIPTGYLLANGDTIQKTEYPELVEVLSGSNIAQSVALPDLRGRFVVGYVDAGTFDETIRGPRADYNAIGKYGGFAKVKLTAEQSGLRSHNHDIPAGIANQTGDYRLARAIGQYTMEFKGMRSVGGLNAEQAHENRPPYYVLAYIVKASYIGEIKTPYDTYKLTLPSGATPLSPEEWLETMKGETGVAGFNYRYDYVNLDTYNENDVVRSLVDGNAYYCKVDGTTLKEPSTNPTEWTIFVMRGAQGTAAPQVLIRYSTSSSTAEGSDWHTPPTLSDVYARFSTDNGANYGSPIKFKGETGASAYPIKIQYSTTGLAGSWSETASATSKYLQFSTDDGTTWSSTISISGGSSVFTQDIQVNLPSGRYFGKYAYNALIQSNGKTFEEVLRDIAIESIAPTASVSASGSLPYNDAGTVDRNITVNMSASSNNGGTITERKLYYRRVGDSTWIELKNQPGNSDITAGQTTYTHNVKDLLVVNNVKGFEYKFYAKDSIGATKEVTTPTAVTPAGYSAPTYSVATPFSTSREMGDLSTAIVGTISQTAQNGVSIVSRTLQYSSNGGAWTDITTFASNTVNYTHNNAALKDSTSIAYRIVVITTSATTNVTTNLTLGTVSFGLKKFFGTKTTNLTGAGFRTLTAVNDTINSHVWNANELGLYHYVCVPVAKSMTNAVTSNFENITANFGNGITVNIPDAGGYDRSYKVYKLVTGANYNVTITATTN